MYHAYTGKINIYIYASPFLLFVNFLVKHLLYTVWFYIPVQVKILLSVDVFGLTTVKWLLKPKEQTLSGITAMNYPVFQVNGRVSKMQEKAFDDNTQLERHASQMPEFHVRLTKTWKLVVPNQPN